jgi:hemin uptake protein HemP
MAERRMNLASQAPAGAATLTAGARKLRIESQRLFQGNSEIVIVHHDEEYNLRITKNGKLILTK